MVRLDCKTLNNVKFENLGSSINKSSNPYNYTYGIQQQQHTFQCIGIPFQFLLRHISNFINLISKYAQHIKWQFEHPLHLISHGPTVHDRCTHTICAESPLCHHEAAPINNHVLLLQIINWSNTHTHGARVKLFNLLTDSTSDKGDGFVSVGSRSAPFFLINLHIINLRVIYTPTS